MILFDTLVKLYEEEKDDDMLMCNGLLYCSAHRMEACGKCGYDHRMTNLMIELSCYNSENEYGILDQMAWMITPRKAPKGLNRRTGTFPLHRVDYVPHVDEALLLPSQCRNPELLPIWASGRSFYESMRMSFGRGEGGQLDKTKTVLRRLRETIVVSGQRWDHFLNLKTPSEPMCRLLMQDIAQTQVLFMELLLPVRVVYVSGKEYPLFTVRYAKVGKSDGSNALQLMMSTIDHGSRMSEIKTDTDEIELMDRLLQANHSRLDRANVDSLFSEKKEGLVVSAFTAIPFENQQSYFREIGEHCARCGISAKHGRCEVKTCSKCKGVQYCSFECQKSHWKIHKNFCAS